MNSINATQAAIIIALKAIPGISVEAYAGQFSAMDLPQVRIVAPSILVDFAAGDVSTDTGTGEIDIACQFGAYCIARLANDLHNRNQSAHALAQSAALLVANNRWGLTKVHIPTGIKIKPINAALFIKNALGVVAVSWTQTVRIGTSVWDGGTLPTEVWLGLSPEIGIPFVDKYQQVAP